MAIASEGVGIPKPDEVDEAVLSALDKVDVPEEDEQHGFRVDNEGKADWAARKLTWVRDQQASVNAQAKRQSDAIVAAMAPWLGPIEAWQASAGF